MKTQVIRKGHSTAHIIPLLSRVLLILLTISIQLLYIPTSNRLTGGFEPKLPIDVYPLIPVWVLPYILCYPLWLFAVIWATLKMDDRLFRVFIASFLLASTLAVFIFIFFPTYVKESTIPGSDIFSNMLRFIHQEWGRYDAFPSGHIYITVLLALFYHRWYPRYKLYWIAIPIVVSFSTLFTHQHYIADIAGGLAVAFIGSHFGQKWVRLSLARQRS